MNELMKVLTIFASIFISLTFITGLYDMNFNPDLGPFNMSVVGVIMLIYLKIKKWL